MNPFSRGDNESERMSNDSDIHDYINHPLAAGGAASATAEHRFADSPRPVQPPPIRLSHSVDEEPNPQDDDEFDEDCPLLTTHSETTNDSLYSTSGSLDTAVPSSSRLTLFRSRKRQNARTVSPLTHSSSSTSSTTLHRNDTVVTSVNQHLTVDTTLSPSPILTSCSSATNTPATSASTAPRPRPWCRCHGETTTPTTRCGIGTFSSSLLRCVRSPPYHFPPDSSTTTTTTVASKYRTACFMNVLALVVLWCTVVASAAAVVWYSYELFNYGTDPHLIAWFSAGAFVLLGFPISMYGIVGHLANYNQPSVQVYVIRILWMVPIYSVESWLAMRFHKQAIYIETLRDLYESYVLYSFLQFLIQVLGGEDALIHMLKDKSPTRGHHMWGLQWWIKPWIMGQPVRRSSSTAVSSTRAHGRAAVYRDGPVTMTTMNVIKSDAPITSTDATPIIGRKLKNVSPEHSSPVAGAVTGSPGCSARNESLQCGSEALDAASPSRTSAFHRVGKRVYWKSPFFINCKFGVLQYVLLKFLSAVAVLILEFKGLYKEGDFTPRGGYLYICILTNLSQCWALYCLILFYYATHTELSPIRPVGKFLSVKALVFFTWWQSVFISILYQMDMISPYVSGGGGLASIISWWGSSSSGGSGGAEGSSGDGEADMASMATWVIKTPSAAETTTAEWTPEDVAKAIQDYLICIEMFLAALVHIFVFPHSEYSPQAVIARTRAMNQTVKWRKRLGRKGGANPYYSWMMAGATAERDDASKSSVQVELSILGGGSGSEGGDAPVGGSLYSCGTAPVPESLDELPLWERATDSGSWGHGLSSTIGYLVPTRSDGDNSFESRDSFRESLFARSTASCPKESIPLQHAPSWEMTLESEERGDFSALSTQAGLGQHEQQINREVFSKEGFLTDFQHGSDHSVYDDHNDDNDDEKMLSQQYSDDEFEHVSLLEANSPSRTTTTTSTTTSKPGFVRALLDSAIPLDLRDNTYGIVKGDYRVERKTLLQHATTSDQYDLFSHRRPYKHKSDLS